MKRVVIIGASSGIGSRLTDLYVAHGCNVGIAARREERLKAIQEKYPDKVVYSVMDVTLPESSEVLRNLIEKLGGMDLLIYCSGTGHMNVELDPDLEMRVVSVNTVGFVNMADAAFNYFAKRDGESSYKPQIATISSVASVKGLAAAPAYSATKRFQRKYFEALAQLSHIRELGISFTAILPGFIGTDLLDGTAKYPMLMKLDYAARKIYNAIEHRRMEKIIDWRWGAVVLLLRLIPTGLWRRLSRTMVTVRH
ncbi:MAG: SDR family NAD(P)-dependent oxidoreductase [Bacteroidales bacterium]|jgi:short-subunit dehydrogenase|nr:SDR family NAD(P)-dependent oxidoreductase [Bacteroidales bacterium]